MWCHYANDLHNGIILVNIAQLTKLSRILIEQDSDPTLLNFEREMLGLPFVEQISLNDARYMHYSRNKSVLSSKMTDSVDSATMILVKSVTYKYFCPDNYPKVLQQSLHGTAGNHPGFSKMMQEFRQKCYLPSIAITSETGFVIAKYAFKINA